MPRVLSDKAVELLDDMPPYMREDPSVQASVVAYSNELQRIEDAANAIRAAAFPSQADDLVLPDGVGSTAAMLSMWESLLTLPVAPPGVSLADRRAKVVAHIRKRRSGKEADWVEDLTEALGTGQWSYTVGPSDYTVTIRLPFQAGSYTAGQVLALASQITPAHINLTAGYDEGFLVGYSLVSIDAI